MPDLKEGSMKKTMTAWIFFGLFIGIEISISEDTLGQCISRSFELRYFTDDARADGKTDFKGETEYFTTDERVEYLTQYAQAAKDVFKDPLLDQKVVPESQLRDVMGRLKSQPLPHIRDRILLDSWKWMGYRENSHEEEKARLSVWTDQKSVRVSQGQLVFIDDGRIVMPVEQQEWRFFLEAELRAQSATLVLLSDSGKTIARVSVQNGRLRVYSPDGNKSFNLTGKKSLLLKLEVDLEYSRYNVFADGELMADFVRLPGQGVFNTLEITGEKGTALDNVYAVGYRKSIYTEDIHSRDMPFSIKTFLDEDYELDSDLTGWQFIEYDDTRWNNTSLPHPHGGERYKAEDLYMRTVFVPGEFERASLHFETLDPGGEIWLNGRIIMVRHHRRPGQIDISKYLLSGEPNILAVRVYPNKVEYTNRHTSSDLHTGWFAGRMHIDLTAKRYIKDLFTYTRSIGDTVRQEIRFTLINEDWEYKENEITKHRIFNGHLRLEIYPWYPDESTIPVATREIPVNLRLMRDVEVSSEVYIPEAELWSPERPFLYKIVATLFNENGDAIDDFVVTTGLRTVSQEGGTFRVNGKPSMMNGALLFGYKSPLDKIAMWLRAGPEEWLVKELLMVKNMNGNTIRMSIHHGMRGGVNDPRLAEIGDQLGIMFQWTTGTWVRTATPWYMDFEGISHYVKQVRNHPSIVMWQPGNHPKFTSFERETLPYCEMVYNAIYPHDPSRLISPAANATKMLAPADRYVPDIGEGSASSSSVWTAPKMTRGDMDHATGYGAEWTTLRCYPDSPEWSGEQGWRIRGYRRDYLDSKERAYFDFESEESIGQPNWNLRKGKPYYKIKSYELDYDIGSIGRHLTFDEWEESQAWQAFSAFEAYKKKRWLDYDGLAWCCLHGGGNTATYQKPLIDYYGHAKLSFYSLRMAFQETLAASHDVDIVYGPGDLMKPVIMHLGESIMVNLIVEVQDMNGRILASEVYREIPLKGGRTVTELPGFRPELAEGYYRVIYTVNHI